MSFLLKGILIYLLLATAISFWSPEIIFNTNSPSDMTVLSWFNVVLINDSVQYNTSTYSLTGFGNTSYSQTKVATPLPTGTGFLGFIDPLLQVFSWIETLGKVLFSPIIIFTHPKMREAPIGLLFIIIIPMVLLFLVSVIGWIRSGEM